MIVETEIDQAVWLPNGEPVYTPERLAKADVRRDESGRPVIVPDTIATTLHDFAVLTDEHMAAAKRFGIWRKMLAVSLGVDRITRDMAGEYGRERQEDNYVMLVKLINVTSLRIVTEALDHSGEALGQRLQQLRRTDKITYSRALRSLRNTYRDAFDDLQKLVNEILGVGNA